ILRCSGFNYRYFPALAADAYRRGRLCHTSIAATDGRRPAAYARQSINKLDKRKRPTQTVSRGRALSDWEEGPELLRIAAPPQPDGAASLVKCLAASRAASDQDWRGP